MASVNTEHRGTASSIVARNSLMLLGRYAGIWGLNAVLVLFLPRYLGAQGLGQLQFAQSFATLFSVGVGLGVRQYLIKEVARDRSQLGTLLGSAIGLRAILACAVLSVIAVVTELSGHSETARMVVYLAAFWMVVRSFAHLMATFLYGFESMGKASVAAIANKAVVAVVGIGLLVQGAGVVTYAAVIIAGAFVEFLIGAVFVSKLSPIRVDFNYQRMKLMVAGGMPFLLLGFLVNVYMHIDVVMLRFMANEDVVGWHAAAFRIYGAFEFLPAVLTTALLPTLARLFKARSLDTGMIASRSIGVVLLVMMPVGLGLSLTSRELIAFLPYPDSFANSVPVLTILAVSSPITALLIVFGTIAAAIDRQKAWALAMLGTVLFNITFNAAAIPYFQETYGNGSIGAAVATLISETIMVLVGVWLVPKTLFTRHLCFIGLKVTVSVAAMAVAVLAGKEAQLGLIPLVGIGAVTYGVLVFALRAVSPRDVAFLRTTLLNRTGGRDASDD